MSVRAYKIIKIETEKDCAFNWTHDSEWLEQCYGLSVNQDQLNMDGGGLLEIEIVDAEEAREWCKNQPLEATECQYRLDIVNQIIADAGDESHVEYYLY